MPESEDDLLPVSALQHYVFCTRRAALVHIEGLWSENRFTAEGHVVHDRVHDAKQSESRPGVRFVRGLELRSRKHRLAGKADLVEFQQRPDRVVPVEYKRGVAKSLSPEFRVQLCAQALCLEEMLDVSIPVGAIYYAKSKKRVSIDFDEPLRRETLAAIKGLRDMVTAQLTPAAIYDRRCRSCSLIDFCLPKSHQSKVAASAYLEKVVAGQAGVAEESLP